MKLNLNLSYYQKPSISYFLFKAKLFFQGLAERAELFIHEILSFVAIKLFKGEKAEIYSFQSYWLNRGMIRSYCQ